MLQITKNDDELLKNYPFLQAIDKFESSHASEHFSNITSNESCWTKHDSYLSYVYSKDKIDKDYYREILVDFLLRKLEDEARNTFYGNAFRCYSNKSNYLRCEDEFSDKLLLEKYNEYPNSNFRRMTVMYIRDSFQEWGYQHLPPLIPTSDFDKKLNEELNLHVFVIKGRFGFQKMLNKTLQEQKKIEHVVFTSTDIIPFASSQLENNYIN
jgi:hypothetical protein